MPLKTTSMPAGGCAHEGLHTCRPCSLLLTTDSSADGVVLCYFSLCLGIRRLCRSAHAFTGRCSTGRVPALITPVRKLTISGCLLFLKRYLPSASSRFSHWPAHCGHIIYCLRVPFYFPELFNIFRGNTTLRAFFGVFSIAWWMWICCYSSVYDALRHSGYRRTRIFLPGTNDVTFCGSHHDLHLFMKHLTSSCNRNIAKSGALRWTMHFTAACLPVDHQAVPWR